jgi:hypothetical protein
MIKTLTMALARFEFWILVLGACFGFRYSDFGFGDAAHVEMSKDFCGPA